MDDGDEHDGRRRKNKGWDRIGCGKERGLAGFADGCASPSVPVWPGGTLNSKVYLLPPRILIFWTTHGGTVHREYVKAICVGKYLSIRPRPPWRSRTAHRVLRLMSSFRMLIAFRGPYIQIPQPQLARCSALMSAHPRAIRFAFSPYRHSMPPGRSRSWSLEHSCDHALRLRHVCSSGSGMA